MFHYNILNFDLNIFDELEKSQTFENITNGRLGTNIVMPYTEHNKIKIPIVRTTTIYNKNATFFSQIHYNIIKKINDIHKYVKFNNGLVEIYDHNYTSMGFHSDQALDLEDNSYICIFTTYDKFIDIPTRKLIIKSKETNKITEIILEHNSICLFSTETNKKYLHKIVITNQHVKNKWFGITFRQSKTFVKFIGNSYDSYDFCDDNNVCIANDEEKKIFYKYRTFENKQNDYVYPNISFTISPSDLMMPVKKN